MLFRVRFFTNHSFAVPPCPSIPSARWYTGAVLLRCSGVGAVVFVRARPVYVRYAQLLQECPVEAVVVALCAMLSLLTDVPVELGAKVGAVLAYDLTDLVSSSSASSFFVVGIGLAGTTSSIGYSGCGIQCGSKKILEMSAIHGLPPPQANAGQFVATVRPTRPPWGYKKMMGHHCSSPWSAPLVDVCWFSMRPLHHMMPHWTEPWLYIQVRLPSPSPFFVFHVFRPRRSLCSR